MLGEYDFHPVRQLIKLYCRKIPVKDLPIDDVDIKRLFLALCKAIDDAPEWNNGTKSENKKIALVFCSKFSRDTAYLPVIKRFLKEFKDG